MYETDLEEFSRILNLPLEKVVKIYKKVLSRPEGYKIGDLICETGTDFWSVFFIVFYNSDFKKIEVKEGTHFYLIPEEKRKNLEKEIVNLEKKLSKETFKR